MNITLTTKELEALRAIDKATDYRSLSVYTQGRGRRSRAISEHCLKALERAGLIEVATVVYSNWGNSNIGPAGSEVQARITAFGKEQLRSIQ